MNIILFLILKEYRVAASLFLFLITFFIAFFRFCSLLTFVLQIYTEILAGSSSVATFLITGLLFLVDEALDDFVLDVIGVVFDL